MNLLLKLNEEAEKNAPFAFAAGAACAVGKILKHRRNGNEYRPTRCLFVISALCLCLPVKWVAFFSFLVLCSLLSFCCLILKYVDYLLKKVFFIFRLWFWYW